MKIETITCLKVILPLSTFSANHTGRALVPRLAVDRAERGGGPGAGAGLLRAVLLPEDRGPERGLPPARPVRAVHPAAGRGLVRHTKVRQTERAPQRVGFGTFL